MNKTQELVKTLYKTYDGEPFILTEGQIEIFDSIFKKQYPRNHTMTYTQFGKSDVVSMAVLTRVSTFPEKWVIVAPSYKKARIVIGYAIQHIFDNPYTAQKFEISKDESVERIRRERSKERLTFNVGEGRIGEMFILSAEAHRAEVSKALMGFGAPNVVEDESALISDPIHSTVMRMLGGFKENFLFKIGNPFNRNHFLRSYRNPKYHKIIIDYKQGIKEGRITEEFIEEMRQEAMFNMLYEVRFPEQSAIDSKGYSPLITETELDASYMNDIQLFGDLRLGCDIAGGGKNFSTIVLRGANGAKLLYRENNPDTMSFVGIILKLADKYEVAPNDIYVDIVGVGKGVFDRLQEQQGGIGVNMGAEAEERERFYNLKAEAFWNMAQWLKGGAKLKRHPKWEELLDIRYKVQSDRKLKLKTKEEMLKEGIASPDVADALALTFADTLKEEDSFTSYPDWGERGQTR